MTLLSSWVCKNRVRRFQKGTRFFSCSLVITMCVFTSFHVDWEFYCNSFLVLVDLRRILQECPISGTRTWVTILWSSFAKTNVFGINVITAMNQRIVSQQSERKSCSLVICSADLSHFFVPRLPLQALWTRLVDTTSHRLWFSGIVKKLRTYLHTGSFLDCFLFFFES